MFIFPTKTSHKKAHLRRHTACKCQPRASPPPFHWLLLLIVCCWNCQRTVMLSGFMRHKMKSWQRLCLHSSRQSKNLSISTEWTCLALWAAIISFIAQIDWKLHCYWCIISVTAHRGIGADLNMMKQGCSQQIPFSIQTLHQSSQADLGTIPSKTVGTASPPPPQHYPTIHFMPDHLQMMCREPQNGNVSPGLISRHSSLCEAYNCSSSRT